jgi:hypothetical protein
VTLNLSDHKCHDRRPHLRGSVRRASGFVLTGNPEVISGGVRLFRISVPLLAFPVNKPDEGANPSGNWLLAPVFQKGYSATAASG